MSVLSITSTLKVLLVPFGSVSLMDIMLALRLDEPLSSSKMSRVLGGGFSARPRIEINVVNPPITISVNLRPKLLIKYSTAGAETKNPTHEPKETMPMAKALFDSKYKLTVSKVGRDEVPIITPSMPPYMIVKATRLSKWAATIRDAVDKIPPATTRTLKQIYTSDVYEGGKKEI